MAKQNKPQNTTGVEAGTFTAQLTEDIERFRKTPDQWTQMRNGTSNTAKGDVGDASNDPANRICATAPYPIIGNIHIGNDEWAIFSTNDEDSEIGIFKEGACTYTKVVNDPCLNFNRKNLIIGVGRTGYDCGRRAYWEDGRRNPGRTMDLDNVPWIQECVDDNGCQICTDTNRLDCDKIRIAAKIRALSFRVEQGNTSGQIINGSYYVVGAYLVEGQRVTDYSLPSNVQAVFTHENVASSLDIFIEEADTDYDEFELILVQFANFNTVAKRVGVYPTRQKKITLDQIDERWESIDPGLLLVQNNVPESADGLFRTGEYTLRVGPTEKPDINYQPLANQIESWWVSVEFPMDYYKNGGHETGHMRDEVYPYFLRWVWDTGDKTKSYHIPGRAAQPGEKSPVSGDDVITGDDPIYWKVYNTASVDPLFPDIGLDLGNGGTVIGGGKMAYWESSELYDDDKPQIWNASSDQIWGGGGNPAYDLCGKPIRHHKFPDNATDQLTGNMVTNHYDPAGGGKIRVMGVKFTNIKPPLGFDGKPVKGIVGYEILRGSREGNKTVLAKGMINNLREYSANDPGQTRRYLYPNYPYNPTAQFNINQPISLNNPVGDHFLSEEPTEYFRQLNNFDQYLFPDSDIPLGTGLLKNAQGDNIMRDKVTFHSPETNFRRPFLSAKEIKVYGEMHGTMEGSFQFPKDHPRHKFITGAAFTVSAIIGLGLAVISTEGERSVRHVLPSVDPGGTYTQAGVSTGFTGLYGLSVGATAAMIAANTAAQVTDSVNREILTGSFPSVAASFAGLNISEVMDKITVFANSTAGATGGTGGQTEYYHTVSPWAATPGLIRALTGVPAFLSFWAEGIDKLLETIYSFIKYRQYALQQVSHCWYDKFAAPDLGDMRRALEDQVYVDPSLQDFASEYRINNLYRSRTVALALENNLRVPYKQIDDTQATFSEVWGRVADLYWSTDEYVDSIFERPASSHYAAIKQRLDNQYGQIGGITQVPVSTDVTEVTIPNVPNSGVTYKSNVLFNGDTYIGRYTEKNTMFFFYDWLKGQPDGTIFNYKLRKMITHPRFWMDTDPFDIGEFVSSLQNLFGSNNPPGAFDPFLIDPIYSSPQDASNPANTNPNYDENAICDCDHLTGAPVSGGTYCYFDPADLQEICDMEAEIEDLQVYIEFLEACACYRHTTDTYTFNDDECEPCNDDGTEPDPATEYDCVQCTSCPPYTQKQAAKYLCKTRGKYKREIARTNRRIKRLNKRLNRKKNDLYEDYIGDVTGQSSNNFLQGFRDLETPNDKHAFDRRRNAGFLRFAVKEAFMYLFVSGVRDFFVETEINIDHRDWGEKDEERHYDHTRYTDLQQIFSTDNIKSGNFMKYDYSLSIAKLFNNFVSWGQVQERDYDPEVAETCFVYRPKRVIYSLPQSLENKKDNWRVYLPLNYKTFNSRTVAIRPIGKNGAIMLFENESPVQFVGVDQLQTDGGTKITIGDGGLFTQPMQNLVNTDYPLEYGSCQNRLAVSNTPAGLFYMSQNQGKIFQVMGQGLQEISARGMKWWFAKYLPYKLTDHEAFLNPDGSRIPFELEDNPVLGIGCQVIYDNSNTIVYFCKKDWVIRDDISETLKYIGGNEFLVNDILKVELGDPKYFKPASWTMSWDPKSNGGQGGWLSWYDFHPDLVMPSKNTFMTIKSDGVWVHNDRCDLYCNYYGVDYPFEVEYTLNAQDVNTLRSVTHLMEVYLYADNCDDRFHVLDFNFDEAIIHNSEQCSGLLRLELTPKNNAPLINTYPKVELDHIKILYSKEEQKYRMNKFFDLTDDRGEFTNVRRTIFLTEPNGYIKNLNPANLNYGKSPLERKKFRHYKHSVLLRRRVCGDKNMLVSLALQLNLKSPR